MIGKVLDGKELSKKIIEECKKEVEKLDHKPVLGIIMVGENPASKIYVSKKIKKVREIGGEGELITLNEGIEEKELIKKVDELNKNKEIDGFIVQLPLPRHIDVERIIERINPKKDVDGFHPINLGRLFRGVRKDDYFLPATPMGIIELLKYRGVKIEGKDAVIIGRSNIVGKPMGIMLLQENATITICHSKTKDLREHTKRADIIISAVGKPGLVSADMVKEGAVVIDVGTTKVGGKLKGDVDFDEVIKKASCSPVPGGVGPMTVAMLIKNLVKAARFNERTP